MIDHITIQVNNLQQSKAFYEKAFAPLGYKISFGEEGSFWAFDIDDGLFEIRKAEKAGSLSSIHVALRVKNREEVGKFYHAALEAGGKGNGAPGPRSEYTPNYHAAFVLDPDGYNIEAMVDTFQ
jgi:catechol 2,3-dioxygenase-like lactoylglutathione lyase family enzyme